MAANCANDANRFVPTADSAVLALFLLFALLALFLPTWRQGRRGKNEGGTRPDVHRNSAQPTRVHELFRRQSQTGGIACPELVEGPALRLWLRRRGRVRGGFGALFPAWPILRPFAEQIGHSQDHGDDANTTQDARRQAKIS